MNFLSDSSNQHWFTRHQPGRQNKKRKSYSVFMMPWHVNRYSDYKTWHFADDNLNVDPWCNTVVITLEKSNPSRKEPLNNNGVWNFHSQNVYPLLNTLLSKYSDKNVLTPTCNMVRSNRTLIGLYFTNRRIVVERATAATMCIITKYKMGLISYPSALDFWTMFDAKRITYYI